MAAKKIAVPEGGMVKQGFPADFDPHGKILVLHIPEGSVVDKAYTEAQFADKASWLGYRALQHRRRGEAMFRAADQFENEQLMQTDPKAAKQAALRAARAALARAEAEAAKD